MLSFFDIQETIFQQSCCIFFNLLGETNPMTLSQTTLERVRKNLVAYLRSTNLANPPDGDKAEARAFILCNFGHFIERGAKST